MVVLLLPVVVEPLLMVMHGATPVCWILPGYYVVHVGMQ
jgi:hypothetical protein